MLALPALLAIMVGLALAANDGGFPATAWYPAAMFTLVLLVAVLLAAPPDLRRQRVLLAGYAAYGMFVSWSYLGIAWADAPADAWNAANRSLFYGLVLALVCLRSWTVASATVAVVVVGLGVAGLAVATLLVGGLSDEPTRLFLGSRLSEPGGYLNATANLWLIGYFPTLYLATSRNSGWPLRGLALAAATLLLEMELLSQSRGALIAFGITVVAYVAITSARWPTLFALAFTMGVTALSFDTLVGPRDAATVGQLTEAFDDALRAIGLSALAALAAGAAFAVAGRAARPALEALAAIRRWADLAVLGLAVAGLAAVLIAIGNPGDWLDARWKDFKNSGYSRAEQGRTRFSGGLGSNRYDFYRVALVQFEEHPIRGAGGDNFAAAYLRHRRTLEAPRHPHSLAFRLLSQHGLVGTALFVVFLFALLGAAIRARHRASRDGAAVCAAAIAVFLVFILHALGDWLWAFPALGVLAFSMLGVAACYDDARPAERAGKSAFGLRATTCVAGIAAAAAVALALPGLASRYTAAAYAEFQTDPAGAIERLERAADLNPLSDEPLVAQGVIEQRVGRPRRAIGPLREAIARVPGNWFSQLELGLALATVGERRGGVVALERARRLNPRQVLLRSTLTKLRNGRKVDPVAVERRLYRGLQDRLRATDPEAGSRLERDG